MDIKPLENRWIRLFDLGKQNEFVKQAFNHLVDRYAEKHRYYHTLEHIDACLKHLDQHADIIPGLVNVEIAIWFHDVIYDPKRNDNEAMSAEYAKVFLQSVGLRFLEIEKIEQLILLTKHPAYPKLEDEKYLLDIDLSILGANKALYDSYEQGIRKEYAYVPNLLYKKGRKKVLNSFAKLERIFYTDYFYQKYESQARQNIARALLDLDSS